MSAFALLISGGTLGIFVSWIILNQRLTHHKELIEHYKDVIDEKLGLAAATNLIPVSLWGNFPRTVDGLNQNGMIA